MNLCCVSRNKKNVAEEFLISCQKQQASFFFCCCCFSPTELSQPLQQSRHDSIGIPQISVATVYGLTNQQKDKMYNQLKCNRQSPSLSQFFFFWQIYILLCLFFTCLYREEDFYRGNFTLLDEAFSWRSTKLSCSQPTNSTAPPARSSLVATCSPYVLPGAS